MAVSSPLDDAAIDPNIRSFFRAIKENPDDDTPRLIFADWLQERGDAAASARGEFLRLNVLRHRLSPADPHHDALKRREAEIVRQHQWDWLGPLPDAARWSYERGMIRLTARAENIVATQIADWARSDAALWIDALTLTQLAHPRLLLRSPLLGHLNRLDLSGDRSGNHLRHYVRAVVQQVVDHAPFLTELILAWNHVTARSIAYLTKHPHSRCLKLLDLRYNRLNDAAARSLAESLHLRNLDTLLVGHNRFTAKGGALLREAFGDRVQF